MNISPKARLYLRIAVAVLLAVILAALLTVSTRPDFDRPEMTLEDWLRQSRITMKIMERVQKCKTDKPEELKLAPRDVNALLHAFPTVLALLRDEAEQIPYEVVYRNGNFYAVYAYPPFCGPFRFLLYGKSQIRYANKRFELSDASCRIGYLPLPGSLMQSGLDKVIQKNHDKPFLQAFYRSVDSIRQDADGNIFILYHPYRLKAMFHDLF